MNLLEIFQALKKRILILVLLIIGFAIVGGGASMLLNEKVYTSTASLIVGEEKDRDTDEYNEITGEPIKERVVEYGSASVSKESEKFYNEILDSNDLLEEVINNLDLDTTNEELRNNITMEVPEDSGTILITIDSPKFKNTDQIVDEVVADFQQRVYDLTEIEKIKTMNAGSEPKVTNTMNISRNILISMAAGFVIGAVVVIILEYLDDSIQTKKDVEEKLGLSVIGQITNEDTQAEDLKNIRTQIGFASNFKNKKSIVVTTPDSQPKNISFDLAKVLAITDKKVLLMDTNFRESRIQSDKEASNKLGLSDILTSNVNFEAVVEYQENQNYQIITAGKSLDHPSEQLSGNKMNELLAEIRKYYDYIIMNSYPIGNVADTIALSTLADGVILVVKPGTTKIEEVRNIQNTLAEINVDILGIVFNEI